MSKKAFQLTLFQKALILVAVPLAFELLLLTTVFNLLHQAERENERAERSKRIIATTNEVVQLLMNTGYAFVMYDVKTKPWNERRLSEFLSRIPRDMASLQDLVKTSPHHLAIVRSVQTGLSGTIDTLLACKRRSEAGENLDVMEAFSMKSQLDRYVGELDEIIRSERANRIDPLSAARLRTQANYLILAGVLISVLIALALVGYFHAGTARRLGALMDNSGRLGRREDLAPVLEGDDEIAKLDLAFHEAAVALTEAQRKERAAIENAVDVICSLDTEAKFSAVSPAAKQLWGYLEDELVGSSWSVLLPEADRERCDRWLAEVRSNASGSGSLENKVLRKDGSQIDMLWSAHWSDKEESLFCVAHDITERKELERFRQEFAQMISHDLRTPLSAVQTTLAILEQGVWGQLTDAGQSKVQSAQFNIMRSIDLINNLLDLEKMEAGKMELSREPVQLREVIVRCADAVATLADKKSIKLVVPQNELEVYADPGRLSQVVVNLLGNAIKFSPSETEIVIAINIEKRWVKVSVKDNGPGIPPEKAATIFERYEQLPSGGAEKQGSGLGLAICKAIIEAHDGTIGVDSQPGSGSTFWFRLEAD